MLHTFITHKLLFKIFKLNLPTFIKHSFCSLDQTILLDPVLNQLEHLSQIHEQILIVSNAFLVFLSSALKRFVFRGFFSHMFFNCPGNREQGNGIYVSISKYGSDTPVTRPETDKAGLSSRDRLIVQLK